VDNLLIWNKLNQPPKWALKEIRAGRLKGKSDINPQWRYHALTENFGPCGTGWKFTIDRLWLEPGNGNEIFAFAMVTLYVNNGGQWSAPIPGVGGSKLVQQESSGPHNNDEAYKMAVTDALSTSCKMLGVASDIYMGLWDGSKYIEKDKPMIKKPLPQQSKAEPIGQQNEIPGMTKTQEAKINWLCKKQEMTEKEGKALLNFVLAGKEPATQLVANFIENFQTHLERYMDSASNPPSVQSDFP